MAYQNVTEILVNTYAFLEWCREEETKIVFVGGAWIEKNEKRYTNSPKFCINEYCKKGKKSHGVCKKRNGTTSGGSYGGAQLYYNSGKEQKQDRDGIRKRKIAWREMERMVVKIGRGNR